MKKQLKKVDMAKLTHLNQEVKIATAIKVPAGSQWGTLTGSLDCAGYPRTSCINNRQVD